VGDVGLGVVVGDACVPEQSNPPPEGPAQPPPPQT